MDNEQYIESGLSVGTTKIANKYEIFTEEEVDIINNKIPELDERVGVIEDEIEEINSSLDDKATKQEVEIERNRIDNLAKLEEGSTTGDAELIDGRVDVLGVTRKNIGTAIREQIKGIVGDIETSVTRSFKVSGFSGDIITVPVTLFKDRLVTVEIICDDTVIAPNYNTLMLGIVKINGENVDNLARFYPNKEQKLTFPYDIKAMKMWIGGILKDGDVTISVKSSNIFGEVVNNSNEVNTLIEKVDKTNILATQVFGNKEGNIEKEVVTVVNSEDVGVKDFNIYVAQSLSKEDIFVELRSDCIKETAIILGGIMYPTGEVTRVFRIKPNTTVKFTPTDNSTYIHIWIAKSDVVSSGEIYFAVRNYYKTNLSDKVYNLDTEVNTLIEKVDEIDENIDKTNILATQVFGNKEGIVEKEVVTVVNSEDVGVKDFNIKVVQSLPKEDIFVELRSDCLNETIGIDGGIMYPTGEVLKVFRIKPNTTVKFTPTDESTHIRIWIAKSNVISSGKIYVTVRNYNKINLSDKVYNLDTEVTELTKNVSKIEELLDYVDNKKTSRNFSIVGDSYSTYRNWIPSGNSIWYSDVVDGGNAETNDLRSVKETWWWSLSNETGLGILTNDSWSGSTICNTGYGGGDVSKTSFIARIKRSMGENQALTVKPDIIFTFGGTNDSWANSPIGVLKYSDWTTDDLKQVLPAFCYMIDYLKLWNPQARIINIVNTGLKADITNGMKTACEYYGVENLVLNNIGKDSGHPNKAGMKAIKDQIIAIL